MSMKIMKILKQNNLFLILSFVLMLLFLSGCGTTQRSSFYQLNETINPSLTGIEQGHIIGIGPIQLPEYINRPQIVTRNSAHHLDIAEFHRWVEPLNESITRVLVMNLSNNLNSNRVYWLPRQDRNFPLELRVVIDIGRFDGELGNEVELQARWTLFDKKNQPKLTRVSLIKENVNGASYEDFVKAMNGALKALGDEISIAAQPFLKPK